MRSDSIKRPFFHSNTNIVFFQQVACKGHSLEMLLSDHVQNDERMMVKRNRSSNNFGCYIWLVSPFLSCWQVKMARVKEMKFIPPTKWKETTWKWGNLVWSNALLIEKDVFVPNWIDLFMNSYSCLYVQVVTKGQMWLPRSIPLSLIFKIMGARKIHLGIKKFHRSDKNTQCDNWLIRLFLICMKNEKFIRG